MATAIGITAANALIRFDTATPGTIVASVPVTGLVGGDTLVGIDFRPTTGQLYGLGNGSRIYTINPTTGTAAQVGVDGAFTLNGTAFGFDFNPVADRIRVTSDADQNLRLNPNNATLTATDGTLAFAVGDPNAATNPNVVASAYTNSIGGSTATTLYNLDASLDALVIQNPPNSGTLNTVVGTGLGVNIQAAAGFDIQAMTGGGNAAFAVLTTDGVGSSLYTINLTTGSATLVGGIAAGSTLVTDLAIVPDIVPTAVLYGIDDATGNLVRINSNNPSTVIGSIPITGLVGGDALVGIDFRPATGQLYGLGAASRLYTVNPITGVATQVGVDGAFTLVGTAIGFDFNPVADRIRVTTDADQDLRLNPNDGTLVATDGTLAYAAGDPNAAANPNVVASAYTNSFAGAAATTLYDLDSGLDVLTTQSPPNSGALNTVGGLGINALNVAGFDIQTVDGINVGFAALTINGSSSALYTINLTTGAATQVGAAPIGGATPLLLRALAVAPFGSFQFSAPTYSVGEDGLVATITINRVLGSEGVATVRLATSDGTATSPGDYSSFDQVFIFGPGETTRTVQIPLVNDGLDESDETINLTLTEATGGAVLGNQAAATLTIVDEDETPVAVADSYVITAGSVLTVAGPGVLANDSDADADPLTTSLVAGPTNGTLVLNADGSFTYTSNPGFAGDDSFTYRASDGSQSSNAVLVTIAVLAKNSPPVAVPDFYSTTQGTPLTIAGPGVLGNDSDSDGTIPTAVLVTGPLNGTLVLNADGSFTYTPNTGFVGNDVFVYRASDGTLSSSAVTVGLTVTVENQPPVVASTQAFQATSGQSFSTLSPGVLATATDADGNALTALLVTQPANGTVTLNSDGSFVYTPNAGFVGLDQFAFRASDGTSLSNIGTVILNVPAAAAAAVGPRVQGLLRYGFLLQPTSLVLQFDGSIDPATAYDVSNYRVTRPNGTVVAIRSIRFLPGSNQVVLVLAQRLPLRNRYGIVVNGGPGGIRSLAGVGLDGSGTSKPGSNYSASFDRANFAGPARFSPRPRTITISKVSKHNRR